MTKTKEQIKENRICKYCKMDEWDIKNHCNNMVCSESPTPKMRHKYIK